MTRNDILTAARAVVGTPFRHQGRIAGKGLDCAGLLVHVARTVGVEPIQREGYARLPTYGQLEETLQENVDAGILVTVPIDDLLLGDMVLMWFEGEGASRHLGIIGDGTLIHSWAVVRRVCEHTLDDVWRRRIIAGFRFAGVSNG